jgi:hypothetical protein
MMLKTPKKKSGRKKKEPVRQDDDDNEGEDTQKTAATELQTEPDPDDPLLTTPMPRYNAMLAVLRNTLYMHVFIISYHDMLRANSRTSYGGIFERGSREYTLDDFYSLALDKMERYVCLKKSDLIIPSEGDDVSSSSGEDEDEDDEDEDDSEEGDEGDEEVLPGEGEVSEIKGVEEEVVAEPVSITHGKRNSPPSPLTNSEPKVSLRDQATAFMGVTKDTKRSEEDVVSTPLPGETLAVFYARSRKFFFWQHAS